MCQVIVTDLFDWIRITYLPARRLDLQTISTSASFGLLEQVATFLSGSDWHPIDAIIVQWHRDQPN
jgi:hypothetical protein